MESNIALRMAAIGSATESPRRGCQTEATESHKANRFSLKRDKYTTCVESCHHFLRFLFICHK